MRLKRSKLDARKTQRLCENFVAGTPARTAAELVGVNRNTAIFFYHRLRELIAAHLQTSSVSADISGLDWARLAGEYKARKRRSTAVVTPVFGIVRRDGKIHTAMIDNADTQASSTAENQRTPLDSVVCANGSGEFLIIDVSGFTSPSPGGTPGTAKGRGRHVKGIETFWNQAQRHLRNYNGIPKAGFLLFLKECEWRYNYGPPANLLKILKGWIRLSDRFVS